MKKDWQEGIRNRWIIAVPAALSGLMSFVALIGWFTGRWEWLSLGTGCVPIAPLTALLLVFFNAALWASLFGSESSIRHHFLSGVAFLIALSGLLAAFRYFWGWLPAMEVWFSKTSATLGGSPVGQISPMSGVALALLGLVLFIQESVHSSKGLLGLIEFGSSMLVFLISAIVILGYVGGSPVFSDGPMIPMSLWAGIAFLLTSFAVALKSSGREGTMLGVPPVGPGFLVGKRSRILILSVIALAITSLGLFYCRSEAIRIRREKSAELASIGRMKVEQILRWRKERSDDLRRIAESPAVIKLTAEWLRDPVHLANKDELFGRLLLERELGIYFQALLASEDQKILLSAGSQPVEMGAEGWATVKKAMTSHAPVFSPLHFTPSGRIHVDIAETIHGARGEPLAVLVLSTDAHEFFFPMIEFWPTSSRGGETLLVRRVGDDVVFLNELRHQKDTALKLHFPVSQETLPAAQAVRGRTGIFFGRDYRGVKVVADLRSIPETDWFLVTKENESEILGEVRFRTIVVIIVVSALVLCVAGGMVLWHQTLQAEERRRSYEASEFQRMFQTAMLENVDVGVVACNETGELVLFNRAAREWHGLDPLNIPQKEWARHYDLYLGDGVTSMDMKAIPLVRAFRGERIHDVNMVIAAKGQPKRHVLAHACPVKSESGRILGAVAVMHDVTARKVAEDALLKLTSAKSRFTSMVSHELRSPIAVIKEALSIVLDGTVGDVADKQKNILNAAKRNVDRLGRLINNVLDFQKIELGKMEFDIRENNLGEVLREAHEAMSFLTKEKGTDFRIELPESLPNMKFDRDKLIQVVTNLLSNAIYHTEKGSVVLAARRENDAVHVTVCDTGGGIPAEEMHKLFQPFEQTAGGGGRKKGGTGLGLAISKEIILAHHGKIWAESVVGSGTTFHFTLPC